MATTNTTMPMIRRYSRPFTMAPTMPSAIPATISSKKRTIIWFSAQSGGLAAAPAPLAAGARLVRQAVVLKDRLFIARRQFTVGVDRRGVLYLLLVVADLEVPGAHGRLVEGYEYQPVPGRDADRDGSEGRQVGAGVDVNGF